MTPGGVHVRNVAHPVIKQAYSVYQVAVPAEAEETETTREPAGV
jgi:hypothetical protein